MSRLAFLLLRPWICRDWREALEGDLLEMCLPPAGLWREVLASLPSLIRSQAQRGEFAPLLLAGLLAAPLPIAVGDLFWTVIYSVIPLKQDLVRSAPVWWSELAAVAVLSLVSGMASAVDAHQDAVRKGGWAAFFSIAGCCPVLVSLPVPPPSWVCLVLPVTSVVSCIAGALITLRFDQLERN